MHDTACLILALTVGCAGMTKPPADAPPTVAEPARARTEKKPAPRAPGQPASAPPALHAAAAPSTATATAEAAPHLDLKGLEQRLKATKAIGLLTKLSLKNQVDDLLAKFRAYHGGQQPPTLADLRPNYELLIMKVQSLIQKDDPALADDVARSLEAIWGVLADKGKFALI